MIRTDNCTLHSECIGCLSDVTSCKWCVDSSNGGKCVRADDSSCALARSDSCDPEIDQVICFKNRFNQAESFMTDRIR